MSRTILVTGAAGFIGSHLSERLVADGHHVVGVDNFDPFYSREVKERNLVVLRDTPRFELIEADIRDTAALADLPSFDAVVHLAALAGVRPSVERPGEYFDVNLNGTIALLELARARGVRDFVFGSSSSIYGESDEVPFTETQRVDRPISPYAASKKAGELATHTWHHLHGLNIACLRFFTVYGPRQRPDLAIHKFTRRMVDGESIPVFGDGSSRRDYTYVADIVDAITATLGWLESRPEPIWEVMNLGMHRTIRLDEMIASLSRALDRDPVIDRLSAQPGDVSQTHADISRARDRIGYAPDTPFDEGIDAFVDWFRTHSLEPVE